jgi:hypothetical protein
MIPKFKQEKALSLLIKCLQPHILTLSDSIIRQIPPRPVGYEWHQELFQRRTGITFDALAAAEALAEFTVAYLLQPERCARLIELKARHENLGLEEVIEQILQQTWCAKREKGLSAEIQRQTEQIILTHLLALSVYENTSWQVKAIISKKINDLKQYIEYQQLKKSKYYTEAQLAHWHYALERMKNPEKAKGKWHKELPAGSPIGHQFCGFECD